MIWDSRLISYKIEFTEEGVKPCIIQLTHRTPNRGLEPLHCNGLASTYTATSRRLLPASITERFLKSELREKTNAEKNASEKYWYQRPPTSAHPVACRWLFASNQTFWLIYGPGAGYLLIWMKTLKNPEPSHSRSGEEMLNLTFLKNAHNLDSM